MEGNRANYKTTKVKSNEREKNRAKKSKVILEKSEKLVQYYSYFCSESQDSRHATYATE